LQKKQPNLCYDCNLSREKIEVEKNCLSDKTKLSKGHK